MDVIKEINIYVKTNASISKTDKNTETDETTVESTMASVNANYSLLTYDMIYQPPDPLDKTKKSQSQSQSQSESHNSKPFFTNNIQYTDGLKYYLYSRGYAEILKFFFNKSHFKTVLSENGIELNPSIKIKKMNENTSKNINVMLELLFPTGFQSLNNSVNSYGQLFEESQGFAPSNIVNYLPNALKSLAMIKNKYSYLKIGGNIQTVYRVVLINDIMNHPKFNFLIKAVSMFYKKFKIERKGVINALISTLIGIKMVFEEIRNKDLAVSNVTKYSGVDHVKYEQFEKELDNTLNGLSFMFVGDNEKNDLKPETELRPMLRNIFEKILLNENNILQKFNKFKNILIKYINKSNYTEQIKKYLIYYEIFITYYQYDTTNIPNVKNIYYKKSDDHDNRNSNRYDVYGNRNSNFNIDKLAKKQMQTDTKTSGYRELFESFKKVSFEKILTDNNNFNNIIRTYVEELDTPDNFLLYLYNVLSLLRPQKEGKIIKVFNNNKIISDKISKISDYCKMTVINSFNKTGEKPTNYEVYIHLDLIGGEVNDTNLSSIKCNYQGKQLGELYKMYTLPQEFWEIKSLPYLQMNEVTTNKPTAEQKKNQEPVVALQGGGKRKNKTRRYLMKNKRKTRKFRKYNK
jgi:hypothetical protein